MWDCLQLNNHSHIVLLIFRSLTVKSVRQQFLEFLGLEKLMAEQKEVFKIVVHDVYNLYSNQNREQNANQGNYTLLFVIF